jgi:hypothetical protein
VESVGRALFSYFNIFSLLLIGLFGIVFLLSFYILHKKKNISYVFYFILLLLLPILVSALPIGSNFKSRIPLLYPIFFSLLLGSFYDLNKKINSLIYLLLAGMFILFITHPIYSVDDQIIEMAKWAASNSEERVLFLPQGFGMLTEWSGNPSTHEYLFSTYLMPINGREVYNGWFGEFAPHSEKDDNILFRCTYQKTVKELFSKITFFGNTIVTGMKECTIDSTASEFCSIVQEGAVDTVFVNVLFPEVKSFVENAGCFEKIGSYKTLTAYKVLDHEPYVDHNFEYTKNSGKIGVTLEGPLNEDITIRESYYPYWKAYLDGKEIPIKESEHDFVQVSASISEGEHVLILVYSPQKYSNLFLYLSILSLLFSIYVLLNPNLQKQLERTVFKK